MEDFIFSALLYAVAFLGVLAAEAECHARKAAQPQTNPAAPVRYDNLTIRDLKALAKERQLPRYGRMRKAELIAALT